MTGLGINVASHSLLVTASPLLGDDDARGAAVCSGNSSNFCRQDQHYGDGSGKPTSTPTPLPTTDWGRRQVLNRDGKTIMVHSLH